MSSQAETVILATGSVPRSIPGVELGGRVIGTEEAWALAEVPARLAVVGAGASGAEIASGFARLGSEVHAVRGARPRAPDRGRRHLPPGRARPQAPGHPDAHGHPDRRRPGRGRGERQLLLRCGRVGRGRLPGDRRRPRAPTSRGSAWPRRASSSTSAASCRSTARCAPSRAGVYAIGDLVLGPALAHKASDEGIIAAEDSAGLPTHPIAYVDIPRATFCTPNVGSFGLTEEQAREQGYEVVVGKVPYGAVGGGTVYGDRTGLVKVVGESRSTASCSAGTSSAARATELIQELVNVRALEGGFPEVARIVHGHPTLSEAVMEAGRAADGWLIHG